MKTLAVFLAFVLATQAVPLREDVQSKNAIVDSVVSAAIDLIRDTIAHGNTNLVPAVPPLDPLRLEEGRFTLPGDLVSFTMELEGATMTGAADFEVERADLDVPSLALHYRVRVPVLRIRAVHYKMAGDLVGVIPLYGEGEASFDIVGLLLVGTAQLAWSADSESIVVDHIQDAVFSLDDFIAKTTGYIGGGDIDNVINSLLSDLVHDYMTRFSRHISAVTTPVIARAANHVMGQVTWPAIFG